MTDPTKLLALASQAIPGVPWQYDEMHGLVYDPRDGTQFDPANNSDQAFAVLAWLLKQTPLYYYDGDERQPWFEILSCGVYKMVYSIGEHVVVQSWAHDGTASSLRAAILEAALRVVS